MNHDISTTALAESIAALDTAFSEAERQWQAATRAKDSSARLFWDYQMNRLDTALHNLRPVLRDLKEMEE